MEISFAVRDFGGSATCQCAYLGSESSFTEIQSTKNNKFSEGRKDRPHNFGGQSQISIIFIGPRSEHSLRMSVTY